MATVETHTAVELLRCQPEISRAGEALVALARASAGAGVALKSTTSYQGASPWLLLWGPGAPDRAALMRRHVQAGGRAIAFDLAYWSRERKIRLSIDAAHPQAWVMAREWSKSRLRNDAPLIVDAWKPTGPIVVAGIGRKAQAQYGAAMVETWEAEMMAACRARWPERAIIQRPKPMGPCPSIEQALRGASLLVTWHSNVAVDAIRLGIPVVCRDGAAAAVCPSTLPDDPQPLPTAVRDRFLANLAWFQWDMRTEAPQCWAFLRDLLS